MTSNLLELQEMLRNLDMGSVQQVAQGQSGKAAQLLGMDEIKRRGEQMQEAKAEEAEQGMQKPPMVDEFLAISQQMMGQAAPMPPQMAQGMPPQMPQQQQGIGSMMPQAPMPQPQMPPQMPMGQPPQQMPPQMMASGGRVGFAGPDGSHVGDPRALGYNFDRGDSPEEIRKRTLIERIISKPSVIPSNQFSREQLAGMELSDLEFISQARSEMSDPGRSGMQGASPRDVLETTGRRMGVGYTGMTDAETERVLNPKPEDDMFTLEKYLDVFTPESIPGRNGSGIAAEANEPVVPEALLDASEESDFKPEETGTDKTKKRNLQPLFDFMMRSGLEYASGKNIGEAGIAGLGATADMGQQRRENARATAADEINTDLKRAQISDLESRQGLTPAEAREKAIEELTETREIDLLKMNPAEKDALIQQTMMKYLPYGSMRQPVAPVNTEQFDRTY